jgi:hypothetical protein
LGKWAEDEEGKSDQAMRDLLATHEKRMDVKYYSGVLPVHLLSSVILPGHCHGLESGKSPDREVQPEGDSFQAVISAYEFYIQNARFPTCVQKIRDIIHQLKWNDGIIDAAFLWMTEERELANANYSDKKEGIFIGNGFHRMVSIGLMEKQKEVKGVKFWFADKPSASLTFASS